MSGLVARPWCLMEMCSKQEIITIVTDASLETSKDGKCPANHNYYQILHPLKYGCCFSF